MILQLKPEVDTIHRHIILESSVNLLWRKKKEIDDGNMAVHSNFWLVKVYEIIYSFTAQYNLNHYTKTDNLMTIRYYALFNAHG